MIEFKPWPKMPRLNRNAVVTEKIDGTNAAVGIKEMPFGSAAEFPNNVICVLVKPEDAEDDGLPKSEYWIYAQSRNKLILPGKKTDNAGFAGWVADNARELMYTLGPGLHFGEWWGKGIQRGYDMDRKVFSLFNTAKWSNVLFPDELGLRSVPVLAKWTFEEAVRLQHLFVQELETFGSTANPGFRKPEGFCIYSESANLSFKVTLENDGVPKKASTS